MEKSVGEITPPCYTPDLVRMPPLVSNDVDIRILPTNVIVSIGRFILIISFISRSLSTLSKASFKSMRHTKVF